MRAMVESVKDKGITQAAIVRPREDGGYEIVSGHRRQKASELAGYFEMPCNVRNLTDGEAITQMVEDNTYNEGHLDGEYLKLPATTEEVQALLKRIHVDGIRYEEIFITDHETDIPGLHDCLGEYESIDELNYLASLLDDMEEWEAEKFAAAVQFGEYNSVKDLINLAQNLDCFELYSGIEDEEDLGRFYITEICTLEVPEHLEQYIDYEAYGRDMSMDEDGRFAFSLLSGTSSVTMLIGLAIASPVAEIVGISKWFFISGIGICLITSIAPLFPEKTKLDF